MTTTMMERQAVPLIEFRGQLAKRSSEFAAALPSHIKPDYFQRAAVTAVQNNPELLQVERRSLLNALLRCAQDGLIPDGRQAALVIFKSREHGPIAQYLPMVAGIRKLVQQSGEISRFDQQVVYSEDYFKLVLGDSPHIEHVPALEKRGQPIAVYSIAEFRNGDSRSYEWMTYEEIERVRAVSRYGDAGPWRDWWTEMARKTVAKRHAKSLPMSNDVDTVLARDDETTAELSRPERETEPSPARRPRLKEAFDRLAAPPAAPAEAELPKKRRGRPPKKSETAPEQPSDIDEPPPPDAWPEIDQDQPEEEPIDLTDPDVDQGRKDARAGLKQCLNPDIRRDENRFAKWRQGFYHESQS
jgi:recombination protein RecT